MKLVQVRIILTLLLAGAISCYASKQLYDIHEQQQDSLEAISLISPAVTTALSMEYKGVISDLLLLRTMTYLGKHLLADTTPQQKEWYHVHRLLKQVIALDPLFWDPYVLVETMLIMQGGLIEEGNQLLEKAALTREQDYRPYFLLWYNAYYLQDNLDKAEHFLHQAAKRPNAPEYLSGLASRMSFYGGRIENGIFLLEQLLKETSNQTFREYLKKRILTFQIIFYLEKKVEEYQQRFAIPPTSLKDLVDKKLIQEIPVDPYGGTFLLTEKGTVYTTSKLIPHKK